MVNHEKSQNDHDRAYWKGLADGHKKRFNELLDHLISEFDKEKKEAIKTVALVQQTLRN